MKKNRVYIIAIVLLTMGLQACRAKTESKAVNNQASHKKIKVFLLAGQSNMDGRARGRNLTADDLLRLEKAKKQIQFFYNHQKPVPLQLTTPSSYVQEHFDAKQVFGPELFFGINLAEAYPTDSFIFIKRSKGGMSLYGAWNPEWSLEKAQMMKEENEPHLYSDFINYTDSILGTMDTSKYEICGMLWVQGEADSGVKKHGPTPAEHYGENLRKLISGVRKELNVPQMPFIIFQVGHGKVIDAMKEIAAEDANVSLIPQSHDKKSNDFYERNPRPLGHYTYKSMKKIGGHFFEYFKNNYSKNCE